MSHQIACIINQYMFLFDFFHCQSTLIVMQYEYYQERRGEQMSTDETPKSHNKNSELVESKADHFSEANAEEKWHTPKLYKYDTNNNHD